MALTDDELQNKMENKALQVFTSIPAAGISFSIFQAMICVGIDEDLIIKSDGDIEKRMQNMVLKHTAKRNYAQPTSQTTVCDEAWRIHRCW